MTVTLHDRTSANKLLNKPCFIEANIKASIPAHKLNRQAIIRDVPLDFSEEEILNFLQSSIPILGVRRLNRKLLSKDAANKAELLPTRTILLTFNGQSLPNDVFLFLVRYNLEVYVPPTKMCFKCFRYGHFQSLCRSKTALCMRCEGPSYQAPDVCPNRENQPKCINRNALTAKGLIYPATRLAQSSYSKRRFVRMQLCTTSLCTKRASFFAGQIPYPTCSDQTLG